MNNSMRELQEIRQAFAAAADLFPGANEMAFDSAAEIYRAGLAAMGVSTTGIHPSGLKPVFDEVRRSRFVNGAPQVAVDSTTSKSLADRFPHLANIV